MRLAKEAREIITTLEENRSLQRSIERVVERENYEWQTLRVREDGKIKVE